MFKKIILAVLLALPFAGFAQKFGTVNIEEIFQAMPESATMQSQLADASKKNSTNSMPIIRPSRTIPAHRNRLRNAAYRTSRNALPKSTSSATQPSRILPA